MPPEAFQRALEREAIEREAQAPAMAPQSHSADAGLRKRRSSKEQVRRPSKETLESLGFGRRRSKEDTVRALSFAEVLSGVDKLDDDAGMAEAEAEARAREQAAKTAYASVLHLELPSLLTYLVLVGLLSACLILARVGTLDYYLADMVRENVLRSELDPADTEVATVFDDIDSLVGVYRFLRGPLLAALYVETSYAGTPLPPSQMRRVNDQNVLVGSVRLQQVRVAPNRACEVPELFQDANLSSVSIDACFAAWDDSTARDTLPFEGAPKAQTLPALCGPGAPAVGTAECAPNVYKWRAGAESGLGSFWGRQSTHDGSGYVVTLPTGAAEARAAIATLEADGFLGPSTRAVWIDFALYNVNINRFVTARLLFERMASGALIPSSTIRSLNLLWYDGSGVPLLLVAEGGLLALVLFFIYLELRTMRREGLAAYWSDISNWYDWPSLTSFGLVTWLRYKTWSAMADVKGVIAEDAADGSIDALVNFQAVGWWAGNEQMVLSASTLIVYLKVLQYLAGVPHISNLLHTLARAKGSLFYFTLILLVLVLAFAAAFHLALGNDLYEWRGVGNSIVSLLRFVLGEVDVRAILRTSPTLGPVLYVLFLFFVVFVAVSIFLAIVTNAYAEERANATYVNLPKVLREAYHRQRLRNIEWRKGVYYQMGAPRRAYRAWRLKRARKGSGWEEDADADADADVRTDSVDRRACTAASVHSVASGMDSRTGSAQLQAIQAMSEEDRAAAALKHLDKAKEAMEGGHLFVLNEVATQLKSMCFREDSHKEIPFRSELQRALVELERLSTRNEALKAKALREGWQWDLASGSLLWTGKTAKVGGVEGAAADVDEAMRPELQKMADEEARRAKEEEEKMEAISLARSLARGAGADPNEGFYANADLTQLRSFAAFQRAMGQDGDETGDRTGKSRGDGGKHRHKHK